MPSEYRFNSGDLQYVDSSNKFVKIVLAVLRLMGVALVVALVLYFTVALLVNTDTEARLKTENKMYHKLYPEMLRQAQMMEESVQMLQSKDNSVYSDVFHNPAPSVDPIASLDFSYGADSIPWAKIISYTRGKAEALCSRSSVVEANFQAALDALRAPEFTLPPMGLPIYGVSYTQVGASTGDRINPFYKAYIHHNGLDFIAHQGDPVLATGDGVVSTVEKSTKGSGNLVVISHPGGYETRYSHLFSLNVKQGQKVSRGDVIGTVGMSGQAYAPHLHFEVRKGGEELDPIRYIFADVQPADYVNMLYMAVHTQQSMD